MTPVETILAIWDSVQRKTKKKINRYQVPEKRECCRIDLKRQVFIIGFVVLTLYLPQRLEGKHVPTFS